MKMSDHLPRRYSAMTISRQIIRSATSAGANYRAACRSKSARDFINKMKIVEEELDETEFWLGLIGEMEFLSTAKLADLKKEANELLSIIVKGILTAKNNLNRKSTIP
jgi:four helix bundle protein